MTPGLTGTDPLASRVRSSHVRRKAIVYVRQSTLGQVERNRESTALQYGLTDRAAFDPDASVRARIRGVFSLFSRHGSLSATLRALAEDGQGLPVRRPQGPRRGELEWSEPNSATLHDMLTSSVYAGAFAWGRVSGAAAGLAPEERWRHLLKDRHPAYISWQEYELNQRQLAGNRWPTRGLGGGLLSGLLFCGRCGQGMTVSYRDGGGEGLRYSCRGRRDYGGSACQSLASANLERFASGAVLNALSPASAELSLEALGQAEADRAEEHERWRLRIARAERDAADARRAYVAVDPGNRLVAQTLEDSWEAALSECKRLNDRYQRCCISDCFVTHFPDCFDGDGAGFFGLFRFCRQGAEFRRPSRRVG